MSRWKASALHLLISALIAGLVIALLVFVWFPPPLFTAAGGARLAMLIVGIDVVLGPLITLVVFKAGKPGLSFDLGVIAALQTCALIYGLHAAYGARPVYLVLMPQRATLVSANEVSLAPRPSPEYADLSLTGPRVVAARPPDDPKQRDKLTSEILDGKPDIDYRPAYYRSVAQEIDGLLASAKPLAPLLERNGDAADRRWVDKHAGGSAATLRYLPLITHDREIVFVLDAATRMPLGPLALSE